MLLLLFLVLLSVPSSSHLCHRLKQCLSIVCIIDHCTYSFDRLQQPRRRPRWRSPRAWIRRTARCTAVTTPAAPSSGTGPRPRARPSAASVTEAVRLYCTFVLIFRSVEEKGILIYISYYRPLIPSEIHFVHFWHKV